MYIKKDVLNGAYPLWLASKPHVNNNVHDLKGNTYSTDSDDRNPSSLDAQNSIICPQHAR